MLAWKCPACHKMPIWRTELRDGVWANEARCCGKLYAIYNIKEEP